MPAIEDDDRPKKKITHEIGQDLTLQSVKELDERVALLRDEICAARGRQDPQASLALGGGPVFQALKRPQPRSFFKCG